MAILCGNTVIQKYSKIVPLSDVCSKLTAAIKYILFIGQHIYTNNQYIISSKHQAFRMVLHLHLVCMICVKSAGYKTISVPNLCDSILTGFVIYYIFFVMVTLFYYYPSCCLNSYDMSRQTSSP